MDHALAGWNRGDIEAAPDRTVCGRRIGWMRVEGPVRAVGADAGGQEAAATASRNWFSTTAAVEAGNDAGSLAAIEELDSAWASDG